MEDQRKTKKQLTAELAALRHQVKRLETIEARYENPEQQALLSRDYYRQLFETALDGILILDGHTGQILEANYHLLKMLEYSAEEVLGKKLWEISAFVDIKKSKAAFRELRKNHRVRYTDVPLETKNGRRMVVEFVSNLCTVNQRSIIQCNIRDISERKQIERKLEIMATHDVLTGLPNMTLLYDRFQITTALTNRRNKKIALMVLDMDYFKVVNDTLGHNAGDELLKAVAGRLTRVLRKGDTIARMGGDEFVLLLPDIEHTGHASVIAEKILAVIRKPFVIGGHPLEITVSIGISIYSDDNTDIEKLIKNADRAMYNAKESGRNTYVLSKTRVKNIEGKI